jgi:hypothetical protein
LDLEGENFNDLDSLAKYEDEVLPQSSLLCNSESKNFKNVRKDLIFKTILRLMR